ncbi:MULTISPECIES: BON domain-containing protein [unclassified Rhizobacter]|uniref:BON domain-containing protein n=1 Tax=unclassified Rhizobacter TaxID=2640088 RepID=UPI0006FA2FBD|nr:MULTISPECIES: BON domain-containing protein [unclassified Rhizobacter]KQU78438.1 transporter [Rhizobacter sp. Root29]KQW10958.1 transporter [Rhizobacter sp. Root1238]
MKRLSKRLSSLSIVVAAVVAASGLSGCAALFIGGAMVGGTLVATDRRTSGAQLEDQSIELKGGKRVAEVTDQQKSRVSVTSYNRTVLLTGEVQTDTEKAAAEQAVTQLENVRTVVNEITLAGNNTFSRSGASDALLTSKVKATLIDARDVMANAFKVVTERGTVYLMGIVTQREADRATDLARSISGVQKVVRVFEVVSEDELARLRPAEPPKPATSSNKP